MGGTWHVMMDFTLTNHAHGGQSSGHLGLLETPLDFSAPEGLQLSFAFYSGFSDFLPMQEPLSPPKESAHSLF